MGKDEEKKKICCTKSKVNFDIPIYMSLTQNIRKDMFEASKSGNTVHADILKLVLADIKNEEISLGKELSDEEVIKVIRKQEKKVKDSITEFTKMNREELVARETEQLNIIEKYLPALMSEEDITKVVKQVLAKTDVQSVQNMGLVMGLVMKELGGKADGNTVKGIVQKLLS